jgi:Mycothiol maleylpyruvate isomerase N-terminal domain
MPRQPHPSCHLRLVGLIRAGARPGKQHIDDEFAIGDPSYLCRARGPSTPIDRRTCQLTAFLDLEPPARELIALAEGVTDDMLQAPTPCGDYTVADLLGHVMGLTIAFRDAGAKAGTPAQDAEPGRVPLEDGWRGRLPWRPERLRAPTNA